VELTTWRWIQRRLDLAPTWATSASPRIPLSTSTMVIITIHMTASPHLRQLGLYQLRAHAGQGPALQAGDVHLGEADLGSDLILVQVLEEPQDDDLAFQRR
jgi:hypothetical protein